MEQNKNLKSVFIGVVAAVITLIAGFGGMNLLWRLGTYDNSLLGLYDYYAASYGDGICLPLLVGSAVTYIHKKNFVHKKDKGIRCKIRLEYVVGIVFFFIGVFWQLSWLYDDNIGLNWTIPTIHHFNVAGWYHAGFFSVMFGCISYLVTKLWVIRRKKKEACQNAFDRICHTILWMSGAGFLFFLVLDDYSQYYDAESLLLILALVLVLLFMIYDVTSVKKFDYIDFICILSGVMTALGIGLIFTCSFSWHMVLGIPGFFLAFIFLSFRPERFFVLLTDAFMICIPVLTLTVAGTKCNNQILIWTITLIIVTLISYGQKKTINKTEEFEIHFQILSGLMTLVLLYLSLFLIIRNPEGGASYGESLAGIVASLFVMASIKRNFNFIINEEELYDQREAMNRKMANKEQANVKRSAYTLIVTVAIGILMYIIFILSSDVKINYKQKLFEKPHFSDKINIAILLVLFGILLLVVFRNIKIKKLKNNLCFLICTITFFALDYSIFYLKTPYLLNCNIVTIFAIFMITGSSLMIAESFYSNLHRIRGYTGTDYHCLTGTILIFIGNMVTIAFCILPGKSADGHETYSLVFLLVSIIGTVISAIVLPVLLASVLEKELIEPQLATTKPIEGIRQNGFLATVLIILGGNLPVYLWAMGTDYIQTTINILLVIYELYWPLTYCCKNNVVHLDKRIARYEMLKEKNDIDKLQLKNQIQGLSHHIWYQNAFTLLALMLYCLIPFGFEYFHCVLETDKENDFTNIYFPDKKYFKMK